MNAHLHQRKSVRLPGYDYSQPGSYFITLVTYQRRNLLGEIAAGNLGLNVFGKIVSSSWMETLTRLETTSPAFIVMPNHFHAIITIPETRKQPCTLGVLISQFKGRTTRAIRAYQQNHAFISLATHKIGPLTRKTWPGLTMRQQHFKSQRNPNLCPQPSTSARPARRG